MEINLIGGASIKKIVIDGVDNGRVIKGVIKSSENGVYIIEAIKKIELLGPDINESLLDKKVEVTFDGLPIDYWKEKVFERIGDAFKRRGFVGYDVYLNGCYYHKSSRRLFFDLSYNFIRDSDKNDEFLFGFYNVIGIDQDQVIYGDYNLPCNSIIIPN